MSNNGVLKFYVEVNGNRKKTITARTTKTIKKKFDKYCEEKGCYQAMTDSVSFGGIARIGLGGDVFRLIASEEIDINKLMDN